MYEKFTLFLYLACMLRHSPSRHKQAACNIQGKHCSCKFLYTNEQSSCGLPVSFTTQLTVIQSTSVLEFSQIALSCLAYPGERSKCALSWTVKYGCCQHSITDSSALATCVHASMLLLLLHKVQPRRLLPFTERFETRDSRRKQITTQVNKCRNKFQACAIAIFCPQTCGSHQL
jgi:hypothetical protein